MQQWRWPNNKRFAVVLSFDVDAEYLWKVWLDREPTIIDISQGKYDIEVGLPRVLALLKRHDIRAAFLFLARRLRSIQRL